MPTPNTADAMKRFKAGKAGFTDKAHLKAKGLIPRADGTKRKSPKYEDLDKDDVKTIKPIIKQLKKSVTKHANQAKQLQKIFQTMLKKIWIDNQEIKMSKK